jgi:WhiB family transcriptional regulator, redox-sensing transcriptional regulator
VDQIIAPALDNQGVLVVRQDPRGGPTNWMVRGACRGLDPELFFPISVTGRAEEQVNAAKAVCGRCKVARSCRSYALRTMPYGIWGGTTMEERVAIRARSAVRSPEQADMRSPEQAEQ